MKKLKLIRNILYGVLLACLLLVALSVTVSAYDIIPGFKLFTVQSGSMEPSIRTGSVIISTPSENYQTGDIITYRTDETNPKATVTHRLVDIIEEEGQIMYVTKGDANDAADPNRILSSQLVGRVALSVPFLGYPVAFAQTQTGLIIMIIIPATLIIYSELVVIKDEIIKIIKKRHGKTGQ